MITIRILIVPAQTTENNHALTPEGENKVNNKIYIIHINKNQRTVKTDDTVTLIGTTAKTATQENAAIK